MIFSKTEQFIKKARTIHGDRYDYSKVKVINSATKVEIVCREHGSFWQNIHNHLKGVNCPACAKRITKKFSQDKVIQLFREVHGDRYDYSRVIYTQMLDKVEIICPTHGSFFQQASAHYYQRQGCRECIAEETRITTDEILCRFAKIHGDMYDYSKVTASGIKNSRVEIVCRRHGPFIQNATNHSRGAGCPLCANAARNNRISKQENEWLNSLGNPNLRQQHKIQNMIVDAYDPTTNTVYEYHGDYWHGNLKIYKRDHFNAHKQLTMGELYDNTKLREQRIRDLGYGLIVMWENEWKSLLKEKHSQ